MKAVPAGAWVRKRRKSLDLAQSDLAAYLTIRLGRTVNQARIAEFESGNSPVTIDVLQVLATFFKRVERLRREGLNWWDDFRH